MATEAEKRTFTREEFYRFVWSAPATKLAKELGCSDVMIGKVCRAYAVPKPYPGYWAQLANGKKPKQTPLPKNKSHDLQTITFYQHDRIESTVGEPPRELKYDQDIQDLLLRARNLGRLAVSKSLRNPHRLVARTKEYYDWLDRDTRKPYGQREYSCDQLAREALAVEVSKEQSARAYRLMDAFIKRIEILGGEVRVDCGAEYHRRASKTTVVWDGQVISTIRLREKHNQKRILNPKARYSWERNRTELIPSGLLMLDTGPGSYRGPLAMDGKAKKLEDKVADLILDFIKQVGEARIARRQREEQQRREAERARIQQEIDAELSRRRDALERKQADESAKLQSLISDAGVSQLEGRSVQLEKSLQVMMENNLEFLLGVTFLASEHSAGRKHGGRIDTLGIDENGCPVIIEYKRATNENVINQGRYYRDWLLDHKAEFELHAFRLTE